MSPRRKAALWLEFLLIFAGAPLLILVVRKMWFTVGVLWAGAAEMYFYSRGLYEDGTPLDIASREKNIS